MPCHLINISDSLVEFARKENDKAWRQYQMEIIDLNKACPACGSHDISRRYRKNGERLYQGIGDKRDYANENCIANHCRTCSYQWINKPLNEECNVSTQGKWEIGE